MYNTLLVRSCHIEKILTMINFMFFTFLGSSMLHVLLFIIEDELTDVNKKSLRMTAVMRSRWTTFTHAVVLLSLECSIVIALFLFLKPSQLATFYDIQIIKKK